MVASPDGGSGGDDVAAATSLRDRILAAFLADGSAVLVERTDAQASLRLTSGEQDRQVTLRVYSLPDRPASWAGIEDKIAASLQQP